MSIEIRDLTWSVAGHTILDKLTLQMPAGRVTGVLGPNGAGKSTLLRVIAGIARPPGGAVLVDGADMRTLHRRVAARRIAFLEQNAAPASDVTVLDVVLLGRIPHRHGMLGSFDDPVDRSIALEALRSAGAEDFALRRWSTLSGGQQQRVQIARALAQRPALLLLDEPTNHLDIHAQLDLLARVRGLGVTSVVALHDLNLAAGYCDRLVLLSQGRLVAVGTPGEVLRAELIEKVYGVPCEVVRHPRHGTPMVVFAMAGAVDAPLVSG